MRGEPFEALVERARGRWRSILPAICRVTPKHLNRKNGPCPMCGGRDRWRFTDYEGAGWWVCNACGSGDGFDLVMALNGCSKGEAARMVKQEIAQGRPANPSAPTMTVDERREMLRRVYKGSRPIREGDPVDLYLRARHLGRPEGQYPSCLRYAPECEVRGVPGTKTMPAMLAVVSAPDGAGATLHRTYLAPDGRKADIDSPKRVMPGPIAEGSAVRLSDPGDSGVLAIAEGIETALAATAMWTVPAWAALNSGQMKTWRPPEGVKRVIVLADNDGNCAGQAAAYQLAHRLATLPEPVEVDVWIPPTDGFDWADEWARVCEEDSRRAA